MKKLIITALFVLTSMPVWADDVQKPWSFALGAFSHISPDYMGSGNYEGGVSPYFDATYQWDNHKNYVFLRSNGGLGVQTRVGQAIVGTSLGYRGGREREENTVLAGMDGVDDTATANLFWRYGHNQYNGGINLSKGLNGANNGLVIAANIGCNCKLSEKLTGSASFNAAWADDTYMNDYFGVNASEATASRRAYKGSKGLLNYGVNFGLSYKLQEKQHISIGSGLSKIAKADDSPIVEEEIQARLSIGYIYNF
ncbi:MAG: outer membrane protein [Alphaproteobacteria bacterium]|jgi:outer membrane protein